MSNLRTKTQQEARFLEINKKFDHGLASKDLSHWDNLFAEDAVLHADGYTFEKDVEGYEQIKKYYQSYIDRYDFEHKSVAGAASDVDGDRVSFSLSVDKGVKPKQGKYEEQHQKGEVEASDTACIHHFKYNEDGKIQEVYFLRQLSKDEQHRKMKYVIDYSHLNFDVDEYEGSGDIEPSSERAERHRKTAAKYNSMWDDNVDAADDIFADDAHIYNLNSGQEREGRDTFKKIVRGMLQDWGREESHASIATSAGNKAFIFWSTKGSFKGEQSTVWGLTFLVFNKDDKIQELATLMQPFPSQRAATLKSTDENKGENRSEHKSAHKEHKPEHRESSHKESSREERSEERSREETRSREAADLHSAFKGKTEGQGETACYKEGDDGRVVAERTDYKDVKKAEVFEARPKEVVYEERLKEEVWEKVPTRTIQERVVERLVAPKDTKSEFTVVSHEKEREYTKATDEEWRQSRVERAAEEETTVVSSEEVNKEEGETVCYREIDTGRVISERTEYKDVKKADIYEARPKAIVYEERKKEERWEKVPTRTVQEVVVQREVAPKDTSTAYTVQPGTEKGREYSKPAEEEWKDTRVEKKHEETNFRSKETVYEDIKQGHVETSGRVVDEHTEYTDRKVGEVIESRPKETIYEERVKEEVWEKVPTKTTQTVEVTREVSSSKGEGHEYTRKEGGEKIGETHTVRKPAGGEWKETRTEEKKQEEQKAGRRIGA